MKKSKINETPETIVNSINEELDNVDLLHNERENYQRCDVRSYRQIERLFDENNEAVKQMISMAIHAARKTDTDIGLCGQAPSDSPEFAAFLVKQKINSISFNPDALLKGIDNINRAEKELMESGDTSDLIFYE